MNKIFVLVIVVFVAIAQANAAFFCYECRNGQSNEQCNTEKDFCRQGQRACLAETVTRNHRSIIKKRCVSPAACVPGEVTCAGSTCGYCCLESGCNAELTPPTTPERGPPGPSGPAGPQGPKGDRGATGAEGKKGIDGFPGVKGIRGMQGVQGMNGDLGYGAKGEIGNDGYDGIPGRKGEPGQIDYDYLETLKGQKGDSGYPGTAGFPGRKGEKGECNCSTSTPTKHPLSFTVYASNVEQDSDDSFEHIPVDDVINVIPASGGFISQTMDFTAPHDGVYVFLATSVANGNGATPVVLFHGDQEIVMTGRSEENAFGVIPIGTLHASLALQKGDSVSLVIRPARGFLSNILDIYDPSDITFSGFKLQ